MCSLNDRNNSAPQQKGSESFLRCVRKWTLKSRELQQVHVSPIVKHDEMHRENFTAEQFERLRRHVTETPHPLNVSKAIRQKREEKSAKKGIGSVKNGFLTLFQPV